MKTQCLRCGQSTHMVDECPLPVLPDDRRLGPATSRTLEKEMDEQPKDAALRLAARQEKGPWLLTYQDAAESATLLRTQHAEIERKDALLRQALEQMGQFSAIDICDTQHHKKADQHSPIAQCPVAERFRAVWFAIKQELSK